MHPQCEQTRYTCRLCTVQASTSGSTVYHGRSSAPRPLDRCSPLYPAKVRLQNQALDHARQLTVQITSSRGSPYPLRADYLNLQLTTDASRGLDHPYRGGPKRLDQLQDQCPGAFAYWSRLYDHPKLLEPYLLEVHSLTYVLQSRD